MDYGTPLEEFLSSFKVDQAWQDALERIKGLKEGEYTELPDGRTVIRLATEFVVMPKPPTIEEILKSRLERHEHDDLPRFLDDSFKFKW